MEGRLLDKISEPFNIQLPERSNMEKTLDDILKVIGSNSASMDDEDLFIDRPMLEVTDHIDDTDTKLWIFRSSGSILKSMNEQVDQGSWSLVDSTDKIIISAGYGQIIYTLAFLDSDYLIFKRYGTAKSPKVPKYLVLASEKIASKMEWNEGLEMLYAKYRNTEKNFVSLALTVLFIILLFIVFSQ